MSTSSSDIAFTPSVKAMQQRLGSRSSYQNMETRGGFATDLSPELISFLAARESLYLGTANADGRPYIQHRGGPPGFLQALDPHTLAFADLSGNRQYISLGNLAENPRAFLFVMDYAQGRRIKIWGRAEIIENDPELLARLRDGESTPLPHRALVFHVEAWDVHCPKHIPRLYSRREMEQRERALHRRIVELQEINDELRRPATAQE